MEGCAGETALKMLHPPQSLSVTSWSKRLLRRDPHRSPPGDCVATGAFRGAGGLEEIWQKLPAGCEREGASREGSSEMSSAACTRTVALDAWPAAPASETLRLHLATSFRDTRCGLSRRHLWMVHRTGYKELPRPGSLTALPRGRNAPGGGGQGPGGPRHTGH